MRSGWLDSSDKRFRIAVVPAGAPPGLAISVVLYDYGPNGVGRAPDGKVHYEFAPSVVHAKASALRRLHFN